VEFWIDTPPRFNAAAEFVIAPEWTGEEPCEMPELVGEILTPAPFQTFAVFAARAVFAAEIERATWLLGCTTEFAARGAVVAAARTPVVTAPATLACAVWLMPASELAVAPCVWLKNEFCAFFAKFALFRLSQL
jgi:hypothetical protein